jgi:cystathionine beta-lyase/cystathionine gamma-synthase
MSTTRAQRHIETAAVHAGERGARAGIRTTSTPIYQTTTFLHESAAALDAAFEEDPSFVYTRHGNPTIVALETALATIEGGEGTVAYACASGMAALHAALLATGVVPGERIVASRDLYGTTAALLKNLFMGQGYDVRFVDFSDHAAVDKALSEGEARVLLGETLSNPLLRLADIPALADLAHGHGAQFVLDSTFTPPLLLRPLQHGADLVIHSTTKYFSGHGDVLGGVVLGGPDYDATLRAVTRLVGGAAGPQEAWLTLRGLKTLPLRFARQSANARAIASWLAAHPAIERVYFPGLADHPDHALAEHLFGANVAPGETIEWGAMLSFTVRDADRARIFAILDRLELCLSATSLGDIYTLVAYPAIASHRELTGRERARVGIGDNLLRLSVGIEHVDDIIADLAGALSE